jgi:GNAT superfamily N-acetyltransferase
VVRLPGAHVGKREARPLLMLLESTGGLVDGVRGKRSRRRCAKDAGKGRRTQGLRIEVHSAAPKELADPLSFLEESLRGGKPIPPPIAGQLERAVERGDIEVLAAWAVPGRRLVGVAVLAFRPNISAGASFASIEDLYVGKDARRRGVGRALLAAVGARCRARGISYVEVQTDDGAAPFYAALGYEPEPGVRVFSRSHAL